MPAKLRVAVIGGGVAGSSLMHAFTKNCPNLEAHVFESAPTFKEAGVAFGIGSNAYAALSSIGPSAVKCLESAGGVPQAGTCVIMGQGEEQGKRLRWRDLDDGGKVVTTIVQRANLVREFFADVPEDRMHASKRVKGIDKTKGSVVLTFEDGTTHECDVLVGADGIHSYIRKTILGEDDPAASPRNSGAWGIMSLKPYEEARKVFENVDIQDAREYAYVGDNGFVMYNLTGNGTLLQFVVAGWDMAAENSSEWRTMISNGYLQKHFIEAGWSEHIAKGVEQLLCNDPSTTEHMAIYLWEHPPARTYVDGPICITGDAAHATTPWQGSGAGMSVEDSYVLSALLGRATTQNEAIAALKAYDHVRRPRTQKIVESSLQTGKMMTGLSEYGLDAAKLHQQLDPRWDHIKDIDLDGHIEDAFKFMNAALER